MSYTILKTDGTALTSVVDGTIDQTSTDLTLVGKNTSGYGIFLNDNFIKLLENFANTAEPNNPIKGQLWYDTTENRLKIYNGSQFVVSGGTIVSNTPPSGIVQGDIWIDNLRQQLYFNDGLETKLAGPIYSTQQGTSGFTVETILDINQVEYSVVYLWVGQVLLGVFSANEFTPADPIAGSIGLVKVGFTATNLTGLTFDVAVGQSNALVASDGTLKVVEDFLSTSSNSQSSGTLTIQNATPLILGTGANTEINVNAALFQLKSNSLNQDVQIEVLNSGGLKPSLYVDTYNEYVGIFTDTPSATLDVSGDVVVQGNLTVSGTTTSISTTNIVVADKNIELADGNSSDSLADGGGITLHGATDKTFSWSNMTDAWTSSEDIDLIGGKSYTIGGYKVFDGSAFPTVSLGDIVTSAPGLTSVGVLTELDVQNIHIASNIISFSGGSANGDVVIQPKGSGVVDVTTSKIVNVSSPVDPTDAANKSYVDTTVKLAPLGLGVSYGVNDDNYIAVNVLEKVYPVTEHQNGTICRVVNNDDLSVHQYEIELGTWTFKFIVP